MTIKVVSDGELFQSNHNKNYVLSLNLPLSVTTVDVKMTSSVPASQTKILAVDRFENKDVFKTLGVIFTIITLVSGVVLVVFIYLTRNKDINYIIKVKRLLNSYRSYIQQITVPIEKDSKEVLKVSTFQELLEIRDTIQRPVLMYENDDKTMTEFLIPTDSNIIYSYDVKVDDYDEIYNITDTPEQEIVVTSQDSEDEVVTDEQIENRLKNLADVDYSFEARLCLADSEIKEYYQRLWQFITSYDVKITKSWKHIRLYKGRQNLAYVMFRGKKLSVALALDVDQYHGSKYRFTNMANYKKFSGAKLLMKLTSERKFKHVLELLEALFIENDVQKISDGEIIKKPANKSKKRLTAEGLIKVKQQ
jgi:predicted transport protein